MIGCRKRNKRAVGLASEYPELELGAALPLFARQKVLGEAHDALFNFF